MATRMSVTMSSPATDLSRFNVSRFTGQDALNACFKLSIELRSERDTPPHALDIGKMVGADATLEMANDQGSQFFTGLIAEASHIGMTGEHVQTWRLELVSPFWQLGLGRRHANYRDQKTNDLVKQILTLYGLNGKLDTTAYQPKATLQHGESDLDFIGRLLAEEGQVWVTECTKGQVGFFTAGNHQRLCSDERSVSGRFDPTISNDSTLADDFDAGGAVLTFQCTRRTTFASSMVAASPPRNAGTPMVSNKEVVATGIKTVANAVMLVTDHHGGHRDAQESFAQRKVGIWISERAKAQATLAQGTSDIHRICAGGSLKLNGHQDDRCNVKWVITEVEHSYSDPLDGTLPVYRNRFSCVPFDGPLLRPELREPPRVAGMRLGIVSDCNLPSDGWDEPGTTSNTGLYAVKFPGEPDSDGNPIVQHMRLAHPWAGPDRGFHFPLEVGDEVVVGHEHGDPGRPFIVGSLHSAVNKGPRTTTQDGVGTSGVLRSRTGHELRFDESKGAGKITLVTASGDHRVVLDDGGKQTAWTTQGKYAITAKDDASLDTEAKLSLTAKSDGTFSVQGTGTVKSKGVMAVSSSSSDLTIESPTKITLKVGGSTITIEPAKIVIASAEIGLNGTTKVTAEAPTAQFGKSGGSTTVIGATVGVSGTASVTASGLEVTLDAGSAAKVKGTTVDITGTGAVTIGGASVGING